MSETYRRHIGGVASRNTKDIFHGVFGAFTPLGGWVLLVEKPKKNINKNFVRSPNYLLQKEKKIVKSKYISYPWPSKGFIMVMGLATLVKLGGLLSWGM